MLSADWGTPAVGALMAVSVAAVYKLLGLALPRIGRSVMADEIDKAMTKAMGPVKDRLDSFGAQLSALDTKHDGEHDRMWDEMRDLRRR